jgi:peptidoglycan/LPS O-acetylase OafA/YrhL
MTHDHPIREYVGQPTHGRNVFLDGLRGISALVVVFFHLSSARLPMHGYLAVDFFFMLSGYVIAGAYEDKLKAGRRPSWFFGVRMARLYPLAVFGLTIGLVSILITYPDESAVWIINYLRGLFFIPTVSAHPTQFYVLNPVMWSLTAELVVNVLYAGGGWNLSNRALVILMICAAALIAPLALANGWNNFGASSTMTDFLVGSARILFGFPFGVLLLRLQRSGWKPKTTFSPTMLVILLLVAYMVPTHFDVPVDLILADAVVPLLFVLMLAVPAPQSRNATVFSWMGRLSYAIYVVHYPIVRAMHPADRQPTLTEAAITLVLIALAALFGHLVIEPWGKRLIGCLFSAQTKELKAYPF